MTIIVICVGRLKDRALLEMLEEYSRRLGPSVKVRWIEARDEKLGTQTDGEARRKEGARIIEKWPERAMVVALDGQGQSLDSPGFARMIGKVQASGQDLCFIIGGPVGLDKAVLEAADKTLSLSKLTFPHRLVRLILIEQIYRAFSILRGEPYHR